MFKMTLDIFSAGDPPRAAGAVAHAHVAEGRRARVVRVRGGRAGAALVPAGRGAPRPAAAAPAARAAPARRCASGTYAYYTLPTLAN